MAAKDDNGGLLSRVVKFVRNPGSGWSSTQRQDERDALVSRQMLQEMIERKRRNDFVRKREFDMLRKMRRSDLASGQDYSTRPSFFQASVPSRIDDRAVTLKKIDDIEAQMSMQWWKSHRPESEGGPASAAQSLGPASRIGAAGMARTAPSRETRSPASREPTTPAELASMLELTSDRSEARSDAAPVSGDELFDFPSRSVKPASAQASGGLRPGAADRMAEQAAQQGGALPEPSLHSGDSKGFSMSKVDAIEVADAFAHDPELEEAAIRFANGDDAGAEAGLLEVLAAAGPRIGHDETWLTLFDLYRAVGARERFEPLALDFARRFGRSAPQWVSLPQEVARMNLPTPRQAAPAGPAADWASPVQMGLQTVAAMNAATARSPRPWRLNWAKLNAIDRAAVQGLTRSFTQWSSQPLALSFLAPDKLEAVITAATPSGDASVDPGWWQLRMELLRLMNRPDEFETVALDYCVTYEVSPPSWEKPACHFTALQADGQPVSTAAVIGEVSRDSVPAGGDSVLGGAGMVCTVDLAGEIRGDAGPALAMLDARLEAADLVVISCAHLIRIDFAAAGMLLNWVAGHAADGRSVQFTQVHRLVAAFFNVIALSEHARVTVRLD